MVGLMVDRESSRQVHKIPVSLFPCLLAFLFPATLTLILVPTARAPQETAHRKIVRNQSVP